jgi:hypothetical protein
MYGLVIICSPEPKWFCSVFFQAWTMFPWADDLTRFVVALKREHKLGANTVLHNSVIVAQFLKSHGRSGVTRELQLPERVRSLPKEYREDDLGQFFEACYDSEHKRLGTALPDEKQWASRLSTSPSASALGFANSMVSLARPEAP